MPYKIIKYSPEFKDQVLRLQRQMWGPYDKRNAAYFDWKYEQNPYLESPLIYLALDGDELVGMRGLFGSKWRLGSAEAVIPCNSDTIIAPDHRKYGVLGKITEFLLEEMAEQGYPCVVNTSAGPATHIHGLMTGWRCIGGFEIYSRTASRPGGLRVIRSYLLKQPKLANAVRRLVLAPVYRQLSDGAEYSNSLFRVLSGNVGRVGMERGGTISCEQMARPAEMAELVERCSDGQRIRHVRDQHYFAWRFRNPMSNYCFLYLADQKLEGFMVLQAGKSQLLTEVHIVDWEATNPGVRQALLDAALKLGKSIELSTWAVSFPEADKALLRAAAFRPHGNSDNVPRTGPGFLVRKIGDTERPADSILNDQAFRDIESWDLRMIDTDSL
jgi:hypothetical protein